MKTICNLFFVILLVMTLMIPQQTTGQNSGALRLGVAGVSHGHVWEVINRMDRGDFVVVGVAERDDQLRNKNGLTGKIEAGLFFADLEEMLDQTRPEAVIVYESIYDHARVVEACAPRGIHVMVEKPLAVNQEHSNHMAQLAREHQIHLLTNYETTWYDTNHEAYRLIHEQDLIGNITKVNVYDGHQGPFEIGCGKEFTDWLTDPVKNGGGTVIDFGCYGVNLATWLFQGERPLSIYAVLKQQKPELYPHVDDDATIVLEYPLATVQIMASWNWSLNRKDMHIYGSKGYIYQDNAREMRISDDNKQIRERKEQAPALQAPYNDPFLYLKAVVRGEIEVAPYDLSALDNNLIVVEILETAIQSAKTGQVIRFQR